MVSPLELLVIASLNVPGPESEGLVTMMVAALAVWCINQKNAIDVAKINLTQANLRITHLLLVAWSWKVVKNVLNWVL